MGPFWISVSGVRVHVGVGGAVAVGARSLYAQLPRWHYTHTCAPETAAAPSQIGRLGTGVCWDHSNAVSGCINIGRFVAEYFWGLFC